MAQIIAATNFKGGVGKSTQTSIMASMFNQYYGKACVVNIAIGQTASDVNEVETFDFSDLLAVDNTTTVSEMIASIYEDYEYIFVDTPGELSEELVELLGLIDYFIIPYEDGTRCINDTSRCLESIFSSGIIEKDENKLFLIHNRYTKDDNFDEVKLDFEKVIDKIRVDSNVVFDTIFTKLAFSKAIKTMEKKQASIETLVGKNKVAYKIFNNKAKMLAEELYDFINKEG